MSNFIRNNKGFSLLELIVVILIMGILAAIIAPNVANMVASSRVSADEATAAMLGSAAQLAIATNEIPGTVFATGEMPTEAALGPIVNPAAPDAIIALPLDNTPNHERRAGILFPIPHDRLAAPNTLARTLMEYVQDSSQGVAPQGAPGNYQRVFRLADPIAERGRFVVFIDRAGNVAVGVHLHLLDRQPEAGDRFQRLWPATADRGVITHINAGVVTGI